ncbi:hypothetical protein GF352_01415 [archaeon]|nr:hypothetical protein [archaeon]
MINIKPYIKNIPFNELLEDREDLMQEHYKQRYGQEALDNLLAINGSVNKYLHRLGVANKLYTGPYKEGELPKLRLNAKPLSKATTHRYLIADGFSYDFIGRRTKNGWLQGPFSEGINNFCKPYRALDHGLIIQAPHIKQSVGAMSASKALGFVYNTSYFLNHLIAFDAEGSEVTDLEARIANSKRVKGPSPSEPFLFNTQIVSGEYINNAGKFVIKGAGYKREWDDNKKRWVKTKEQAVYTISNKQTGLFVNGRVVFLTNIEKDSDSPVKSERVNVQEEFHNYKEKTKHEEAADIALIKGNAFGKSQGNFTKDLVIRVPKNGANKDNMDYLKLPDEIPNSTLYGPGDVIKPVTFYGLAEDLDYRIGQYVHGLQQYLYYVEGLNGNEVAYHVLDNFWDLIITPELLVQMILGQHTMMKRYRKSRFRTGGAVKKGVLRDPSQPSPYKQGDYSIKPEPYYSYVDLPAPSSRVQINNGSEVVEGELTLGTIRMQELHPCTNNKCKRFQRYYPKNRDGSLRHVCKEN